jgi:YVTN family beta-propeller protein
MQTRHASGVDGGHALRWPALAIGVAVVMLAWGIAAGPGETKKPARHSHTQPAITTPLPPADGAAAPADVVLEATRTGSLRAPLQDAAAAALSGGEALLVGGLTAADTSSSQISIVHRKGNSPAGRLPVGLHDAAAATLGGRVYLFGGGNLTQYDGIVQVDPAGTGTTSVGRLPAPSSDQAAAAIGPTAYIVGGYTGTRWLDTIVAWRPGAPARIAAHLPHPVRYAAVTAAAGHLVIAGGSLVDGSASRAVYEFTPETGAVTRIGRLPAPTTHAAAAAIGDVAFVIGGRGAKTGTATDRIVAVDLAKGTVRPAGQLLLPMSDTAAVAFGDRILLAGGSENGGATRAVYVLGAAPQGANTVSGTNVYAADGPNMLTGAAKKARPLIYVPNSGSNTVDVIDPATNRIIREFPVGGEPQHVVPSWDLRRLYVTSDRGNSLTPIDPVTGKPGRPISVADPYNMYFTPDGRHAIVVAERLQRLDFRDPHTFRLQHSLPVPCSGVDHVDFSADGTYLIASCEFSGEMLKVDVVRQRVVGTLRLPSGSGGMPQDVKLSPDGRTVYVADMMANGLWVLDPARFKVTGFIHTGIGVHGLYPSRDARYLYATNRGEGTISVISFRTKRIVKTWRLPGGGSPDMGGVSADGKVLWLSGRWNSVVYEISTVTGKLLASIPVGLSPHGLCVWPQPGRYSLGHTGILR